MERLTKSLQLVLTALCGLFLTGNIAAQLAGNAQVATFTAYAAVACGAYFALGRAYESLSERRIDVDFLMVFAAIGAIVVHHPEDAAVLLFLFSLSSTMEALAMGRTKSAIEGLVRLRPSEVVRVSAAGDERVPVENLQIGDLVRVAAFETIPVDGEVDSGTSTVDQSAMTGESVPVTKGKGERVLGGTQNLDGLLVVKVLSTVGDSTLDKIVELVEQAQENKASGERISEWFGQRYTLFVIGAFAVAFVVRLALKVPVPDALYEALVLLVALSPCALVISTPATTLSALAWAARSGILIRGGQFVELVGQIDTVALDKTGTLTMGRPKLAEICVCALVPVGGAFDPDRCDDESACWHGHGSLSDEAYRVLRSAAAVEQYAQHPIAEAIVRATRDNDVLVPQAVDHKLVPGQGAYGVVDGLPVYVGQVDFLAQNGIDVPLDFQHHVANLSESGMPMAMISVGHRIAALGFADTVRESAPSFVRELSALGVGNTVMLTGDRPSTAKRIAESVGLSESRAGLLPAGKAEAIQEMVTQGKSVMMVGDGINDAPALSSATVGVAMGGLGSDIALNSADVVLMHDRLERIPELVRLGRKTNRIIRANLLFAAGVIVTLTLSSFFTKLPLPIAVIGHEGSTVLVILNGLRLLSGPGK